MIPKLVELLKVAQYRSILLRILYHLSSEDKIKNTFAYTSCIPLVYQLIIHFPDQVIGKELISLIELSKLMTFFYSELFEMLLNLDLSLMQIYMRDTCLCLLT